MCGIAGFWSAPQSGESQAERLRRMTDAIAYRGPDDAGLWIDHGGGVGLGHRRLSIVDLSPEGHQPMRSASGRYIMVFNGEVYNFVGLRRELEALGHRAWRGHSDTEVMLAAFQQWGVRAATERFDGMFAFAVWDTQEGVLHLVRDRMGIKPLYYGWQGGTLLFASELKALRAHPGFEASLDVDSVGMFLRYDYIPGPATIYRGVHKLVPGAILSVRAADRKADPVSYWSVADAAARGVADPFQGDNEELSDELESLLRRIVGEHMVADVPLGAFLSGGIDSSLVVAMMQGESRHAVRTFSIGFAEQGFDEATHARAVAAHLGTAHTELYVTPQEMLDVVPLLPSMYDEPFADSSQVPTYLVSKLARQSVTVSLSGDGGDELFGGYDRYAWSESAWRSVSRVPRALRALSAGAVKQIPDAVLGAALRGIRPALPPSMARHAELWRLRLASDLLAARDRSAMYERVVSHLDPRIALSRDSRSRAVGDYTAARETTASPSSFRHSMMMWDQLTYLPDDILVKVDRASMAVSLEARVPLLDHRLVEFAWSIPEPRLHAGGRAKLPLRAVLARHVPSELFERPKMGFSIPIGQWMRGPLRDLLHDLLSPARIASAGLVDQAFVARLLSRHDDGAADNGWALWNLFTLHAWLDGVEVRS